MQNLMQMSDVIDDSRAFFLLKMIKKANFLFYKRDWTSAHIVLKKHQIRITFTLREATGY